MLIEAGALVTAADINSKNLDRAVQELGVTKVSLDDILASEVDVLAPCALGGAINSHSINKIRAGIVAGAANNQLRSASMGGALLDRGILYAPDYVINAGGIIDVFYQQQGERSQMVVNAHVENIGKTLNTIFKTADVERRPTNEVADEMAQAVFGNAFASLGKLALAS